MNASTQAPEGDVGAMLSADDLKLIRQAATNAWELVDDFSVAHKRIIHERIPELGGDDPEALEATRRSSIGSMYEFLTIMRAGIFAPQAIETSPEALEHARFLQSRGIGLAVAVRWYNLSIAMFEPLVVEEFEHLAPDNATLEKMKGLTRQFIFVYVDQITKRLAFEYANTEREGWVSDPDADVLHDPGMIEAAHQFLREHPRSSRAQEPVAARKHCERAFERFCVAMETAAEDPKLSHTLARADTTVRVSVSEEPDLACTLLLDREPIEVVDGDTDSDVQLSIASVDLDRLRSPDFHLSMAIARGRVRYVGNVRKFLRVTPVVRHASLPGRRSATEPVTASS